MQSFDDLLQDQSKSTSYNTTNHAASSVTETLVDPQTGELLHSYPENAGGSQAHQPFAFDEPKTPFNQQDNSFAKAKPNSFRLPQSHAANFFRWFHFLYPLICAGVCSTILGNFSMNQMTHVVLATPSGKKYFQLGDMPIPLLRIHQIQDDLIILIDAVGKPHILLRERSSQ